MLGVFPVTTARAVRDRHSSPDLERHHPEHILLVPSLSLSLSLFLFRHILNDTFLLFIKSIPLLFYCFVFVFGARLPFWGSLEDGAPLLFIATGTVSFLMERGARFPVSTARMHAGARCHGDALARPCFHVLFSRALFFFFLVRLYMYSSKKKVIFFICVFD